MNEATVTLGDGSSRSYTVGKLTAIESARVEIAKILKAYEQVSGNCVKAISLREIETTGLDDTARKHQMMVDIETYRLPGHAW